MAAACGCPLGAACAMVGSAVTGWRCAHLRHRSLAVACARVAVSQSSGEPRASRRRTGAPGLAAPASQAPHALRGSSSRTVPARPREEPATMAPSRRASLASGPRPRPASAAGPRRASATGRRPRRALASRALSRASCDSSAFRPEAPRCPQWTLAAAHAKAPVSLRSSRPATEAQGARSAKRAAASSTAEGRAPEAEARRGVRPLYSKTAATAMARGDVRLAARDPRAHDLPAAGRGQSPAPAHEPQRAPAMSLGLAWPVRARQMGSAPPARHRRGPCAPPASPATAASPSAKSAKSPQGA